MLNQKNTKNVIPDISKDFLFDTVPVIYGKDSFIIYSPFTKQIIKVKNFNKKIREKLDVNFFGPVIQRQLKPDYGHLSIITTTDCNLRCQYCFANGGERPDCLWYSKQIHS